MDLEKQEYWINHIRWIEGINKAVCDGMTESMDLVGIVMYPLFIITGLGIFMFIYNHWEWFKEKL